MAMNSNSEYRVVWKHQLRGLKESMWMEKICPTEAVAQDLAASLRPLPSCSVVSVQSREVTPWAVLENAA
jgi:hypothetical protein